MSQTGMELKTKRDFARTMAEVPRRRFVTRTPPGSRRAYGQGPGWIRVVGPSRYRLLDGESFLAENEYRDWLCLVSLQQPEPVGLNESALMTEESE